ncbi:MAG: trigger factor [Eubacteriales bacterium]|nr:trigger factor [Eubacteriales bacterium]
MEHTVEKLAGNKVKISFKATATEFEDAIQKAYLKMRGQINVPGFRKGKAPRRMIENMFGKSVFYEDALEILFPEAYATAVREDNLQPVSRPELDVQEMEAGKDLAYTCEIFVMPEVKLGAYKDVAVTRSIRTITDKEIDTRIEQEQKRVARSVEVTDRPLANGDKAELDYSGSVDGVKFEGGTAEKQTLLIGSGSFIPGFEEQMVGMTIGEEKDLSVKFPDEYHSEELKGKDAIFHVKLLGITKEELPALDDDFAAEVSDFDTMSEYRADIQKSMQEAANVQADEAAKQSLIDTVVEAAECDIPAPMVEDKLDEMMQQMGWRMQQQGFSMEQYMKMLGQTEAQMREMYRSEADKNVKTELVIDEIIKQEAIEADDADVEKLLEGYTAAMGKTVAELKETVSGEQLDYFKHRAQITKAVDMMWTAAKVTDEEIKDEPKADSTSDEVQA